jgi:hypothetical protein
MDHRHRQGIELGLAYILENSSLNWPRIQEILELMGDDTKVVWADLSTIS